MKFRMLFTSTIITLCLLLFGCEAKSDNPVAPTTPTTLEATTFGQTSWQEIIADSDRSYENTDGNIYFAYDRGIWLYDTKAQSSSRISLRINNEIYGYWANFCVYDNFIYYLSPENAVMRARLDNLNDIDIIVTEKKMETVLNCSANEVWISEILNDDILLLREPGLIYDAYNLKTGELFRLHDDVDSMAVLDDMLYFVEHTSRTFSLYRKPLYQPDAQPELLLGKGSTRENGESDDIPWIRSVFIENDRLFFMQNDDELWEFKEDGQHVRIDP